MNAEAQRRERTDASWIPDISMPGMIASTGALLLHGEACSI